MDEIQKPQTINVKSETHQHSGKLGFWGILGILLVVLFIISVIIDIREDGVRCIKLKDCKPLGVSVLTKIFMIDYHIDSEVKYLKDNSVILSTPIDSTTIVPERAVRSDLFINILFYIVLLMLVIYLSYIIGKRGFTGVLSAILGLAIYSVLSMLVTYFLVKDVYMPFSCFISLFNYAGVLI